MQAVLTYHSIDDSGSMISVPPAAFRAHVAWLTSGTIAVVDLETLLTLPPERDAVALTFDDGYANLWQEVVPLLRSVSLPATVFVVSGHVGSDNRWRGTGDPGVPILPLLGWGELDAMAQNGWTIGAHGRSHPRLPDCVADDLIKEVEGSRDEIARALGSIPRRFAYPYGATNPQVTAIVAPRFAVGCTTDFRPLGTADAPAQIPRLDAWYFRDHRRLETWGSAGFRRWIAVRRTLRAVRRIL